MGFPEFCDGHKRWFRGSCDYCDAEDRSRMSRMAKDIAALLTRHWFMDHEKVAENDCHHKFLIFGVRMNIHQARATMHEIESMYGG